ncbi:MAG: RluA family pseudouridine synthase, partial [Atribacterota bacterium]
GDHYSLLLAYPRTGRTHQIRVHLSSCGTPIAGDTRYAARPVTDLISRQALHAFILSFSPPITGHHLTCAAALPADFRTALDKLGM